MKNLFSLRLLAAALAAAFTVSTSAARVLVDFGSATTQTASPTNGLFWNNLVDTDPVNGNVPDLTDTLGNSTGLTLAITSRFNTGNNNGRLDSTLYPASATRDSFYGNTETFNGLSNLTPQLTLSGLTVGTPYSFTFYASRDGVADNRSTDYTVAGAISGTATLNASNNINNVAVVSNILPMANGTVTINLTPNASNNNASHFVYLGVLDFAAVPEPTTTVSLLVGGVLCLARRRRASKVA